MRDVRFSACGNDHAVMISVNPAWRTAPTAGATAAPCGRNAPDAWRVTVRDLDTNKILWAPVIPLCFPKLDPRDTTARFAHDGRRTVASFHRERVIDAAADFYDYYTCGEGRDDAPAQRAGKRRPPELPPLFGARHRRLPSRRRR